MVGSTSGPHRPGGVESACGQVVVDRTPVAATTRCRHDFRGAAKRDGHSRSLYFVGFTTSIAPTITISYLDLDPTAGIFLNKQCVFGWQLRSRNSVGAVSSYSSSPQSPGAKHISSGAMCIMVPVLCLRGGCVVDVVVALAGPSSLTWGLWGPGGRHIHLRCALCSRLPRIRRAFVFVAVRVAVDLPKTLFRGHTPLFVEPELPDLSFAFVLCWAAFFVRS